MATVTLRQQRTRSGTLYFPVVTTILMVLSFLAFSDNLITDVGQPSNSDPHILVHSLFSGAWVIAFSAQAWLIYLGKMVSHRRAGKWVFAIGAGLALSTVFIFITRFRGFSQMGPEVIANRLLMIVFVVCTTFAYLRRNRIDWHKRLLLVGTIALAEPVLARLYDPVFGPLLPSDISKTLDTVLFTAYLFAGWLTLLGSLALYDRRQIGRVHPATLYGSGAIAACNAAAYLV